MKTLDRSHQAKMFLVIICIKQSEPIQQIHKLIYDYLKEKMAIIIIITQSIADEDKSKRYFEFVQKTFPEAGVVEVNSVPFLMKKKYEIPAFGIEELIRRIVNLIRKGQLLNRQWRLRNEFSIPGIGYIIKSASSSDSDDSCLLF